MRWRIRQYGNQWAVIQPDGAVLTASGATIAADAITAASEAGQFHGTYQDAMTQLAVLARPHLTALAAAAGDGNGMPTWVSDAAFEGEWTSDGRFIEQNALTWRDPPMPLMFQDETEIGHFGAELAGWVSDTSRNGTTIVMRGGFDASDEGEHFCDVIEARGSFGVSIDLGAADGVVECVEEDQDGWCMRWEERLTAGEIIGLTGTPFPAFAAAAIRIDQPGDAAVEADAEGGDTEGDEAVAASARTRPRLVAASFPVRPPADWFADPQFSDDHPRMAYAQCEETGELRPTGVPLTIEDNGRIFGHLFAWGTCHTGYPNDCVQPPSSPTGYAYFRTGEVVCDDGARIATGVLTMGIGHADLHLSARDAQAHYDDSRYGFADVAVGEDGYGAWYAGSVRPGVTDDQVRAAQALSLSGDWRTLGGHLELIAALAVNHPGFPILRQLAAAAGVPETPVRAMALRQAGRPTALVASGMIPNRPESMAAAGFSYEARFRAIEQRVAAIDARTAPLRASAAQAMRDRVAAGR